MRNNNAIGYNYYHYSLNIVSVNWFL